MNSEAFYLKQAVGIILGMLFLLTTAHAASFDCGKATSDIEKLICGNEELSRLDESLNKAYLKALERPDIRKQMIESQRQWLKNERNACKNVECLKKAYETRLKELGLSSYGIVIESPPHSTASPSKSPPTVSESQPTEPAGKAVETEPGQPHEGTATVAEPVSGTYSRSDLIRDWGASEETYFRAESEMVLSMKDKDTFHFDLGTVGPNFHTCALSGLAVRRGPVFEYTGTEPAFNSPDDCMLKFWFRGNSVRLEHEPGKCRDSCGQRAMLDGAILFRSGNHTETKPSDRCTFCDTWRPYQSEGTTFASNDLFLVTRDFLALPGCSLVAARIVQQGFDKDYLDNPSKPLPIYVLYELREDPKCKRPIPGVYAGSLIEAYVRQPQFRDGSERMELAVVETRKYAYGERTPAKVRWNLIRDGYNPGDEGSGNGAGIVTSIEHRKVDEKLNEEWQRLLEVADEKQRIALIRQQRRWLKAIDERCREYGGASPQWESVYFIGCLTDAFQRRIGEFQDLRNCIQKKTSCPALATDDPSASNRDYR